MCKVLHRTRDIVVVLTGLPPDKASRNNKTGKMGQLSVLPVKSLSRPERAKTVCKSCPLLGHGCYVVEPYLVSTWECALEHPIIPLDEIKIDRPVRVGQVGNISAVKDKDFLADLFEAVEPLGWTGYDADWERNHWLAGGLMASCQFSYERTLEAQALGFKTTRILRKEDEPRKGEVMCRHAVDGTQCIKCMLCDGSTANVCLPMH